MIRTTNTGVDAEMTARVKKAVHANVSHDACGVSNVSTSTRVHTSRSIGEEHVESASTTAVSSNLAMAAPHNRKAAVYLREYLVDAIDVTRAVH
jgi:hypothetical protein